MVIQIASGARVSMSRLWCLLVCGGLARHHVVSRVVFGLLNVIPDPEVGYGICIILKECS